MPFIPAEMPPTPASSVGTPSRRTSFKHFQPLNEAAFMAGPSAGKNDVSFPDQFPPTPPAVSEPAHAESSNRAYTPSPHHSDSGVPQRPRRHHRRPMSGYPLNKEDPAFPSERRYEAVPSPRSQAQHAVAADGQKLDLDFNSYGTYDEDVAALENREPTLSFVTTSTASSHDTPPISHTYGSGQYEQADSKNQPEPRIRVRAPPGRNSAYSSAESSMASGPYSYHAYGDQGYHSHAPPVPVLPSMYASPTERVGLGITSDSADFIPERQSPRESVSSPSNTSFGHRPWLRGVAHLRGASISSATTTSSASTTDDDDLNIDHRHSVTADALNYLLWETSDAHAEEPKALTSLADGKDTILDRNRLDSLGGLPALTEDAIRSLSGITHLLLPAYGADIQNVLPSLLLVAAPSLLVLDLSDNDLTSMPDSLKQCLSLEELNLSGNMLRSVPPWFGHLVNMRMLILDDCGLATLPSEMASMVSLHTLGVRRNRMASLPPWLCLLSQLDTLRVEGNPFAPEWQAIVAPILARPFTPRSPMMVQNSLSHDTPRSGKSAVVGSDALSGSVTASSIASGRSTDVSSTADLPWLTPLASANGSTQHLSLHPISENDQPRTAPVASASSSRAVTPSFGQSDRNRSVSGESSMRRTLRKMRSAGTLLHDSPKNTKNEIDIGLSVPGTPALQTHDVVSNGPSRQPSSAGLAPPAADRYPGMGLGPARKVSSSLSNYADSEDTSSPPSSAGPSQGTKSGKWGFLRKMSMHKLKADKPASIQASAAANIHSMPKTAMVRLDSEPLPPMPRRPGIHETHSALTLPTRRGLSPAVVLGEFGQMPPGSPGASSTMPASGLPQIVSSFVGGNHSEPSKQKRGKRRSFLPIDPTPPSISVHIPSTSPFMSTGGFEGEEVLHSDVSDAELAPPARSVSALASVTDHEQSERRYGLGLESIKSYLRDLHDLSRPPIEPYGGFEVIGTATNTEAGGSPADPSSPVSLDRNSLRERRPTLAGNAFARQVSGISMASTEVGSDEVPVKKRKDDKAKRARVLREIYETERTYVRGLGELVSIYVRPASQPVKAGQSETVVPLADRKIVFGGIESILTIHRDNLLPALEKAIRGLLEGKDDDEGRLSTDTAHQVGEVFRTYIAYMKQYSTYTNNYDNALSRMKGWTATSASPAAPGFSSKPSSPNIAGLAAATSTNVAMAMTAAPDAGPTSSHLSSAQKKRVKTFLKRCRENPRHSQINLESYLLLPVQRIPRYKLLLEDLELCTPPRNDGQRDALDDALSGIAQLAFDMNEDKRDADSRMRLLQWQQRISSRGPSPLVQPHRRLILDGGLNLIRLVKKASAYVEVVDHDRMDREGYSESADYQHDQATADSGDGSSPGPGGMPNKTIVPVEYIAPEPMNRPMMLILCTDLLVLLTQRDGQAGWEGTVDLFNVLRMATVKEPASIVNGNVLRIVDNKSIYYFNGASHSALLEWCRAINSARRR